MVSSQHTGLLNAPGVAAVTSLIDLAIFQDVPVTSIMQSILSQWTGVRDRLFAKKVMVLLNELQNADSGLIGQVIDNLRAEHGAEYFDEVLFNSIEMANSSEMAKLLSRALIAVSLKRIPLKDFWIIAQSLKFLTLQDIKLLESSDKIHIIDFPHDSQQRMISVGLAKFQVVYGGGEIDWHRTTLVSFLKVITGRDDFKIEVP